MHEPFLIHLFDIFFIIGAFYFVLGNLRPQYRSVINMIQLVALCKTPLISTYGMNRILQPFMRDLRSLESVSSLESVYSIRSIFNNYLPKVKWIFINIHEPEANNCFIIYKTQGKCRISPRKIEKDQNVPPFVAWDKQTLFGNAAKFNLNFAAFPNKVERVYCLWDHE